MHHISRSSSSIIEVAQNPLRVLFVIRECEVLSQKRINGEKFVREREWKRGAKEEDQASVYPSAPNRRWMREATGGKGGEEEGEGSERAKRESNENESRRAQFVVALICHRVPPSLYHPLALSHLPSCSAPLRFYSISSFHTHYIYTHIHHFHCYNR